MSEEDGVKKKLTLSMGAKPALPSGPKTVTVEVRKKRTIHIPGQAKPTEAQVKQSIQNDVSLNDLQRQKKIEILERARTLDEARKAEEEARDDLRKKQEEKRRIERESAGLPVEAAAAEKPAAKKVEVAVKKVGKLTLGPTTDDNKKAEKKKADVGGRKTQKITIQNFNSDERHRSLASVKRQRDKTRREAQLAGLEDGPKDKVLREVIIPEAITVGELANRMTEKASNVVRELMKMGLMVTINQTIDADTAEIICTEFGHAFKRVTEADVENVIDLEEDDADDLRTRPPVVTIMGHVDHGKTSLLDAMRKTDVVSGEAGGITQHIGAYQVRFKDKGKITFIDTPGHAAFTEMRARGAKVTDIVVIVIAADDGIKEQTVEAINHAKAAGVAIIVAINKIDKPGADIQKAKNELLQHSLIPEDMGGDIQCIPVSAKTGAGLDDLKEAIMLQAEVLDLKANPKRAAIGRVIEARVDKGRGVVATVIIQRGTLRTGAICVAGTASGRVRALLNSNGKPMKIAKPSTPVEVLGLSEAPMAGDEFNVVESEKQGREITQYRREKAKNARAAVEAKSAMEKLMVGAQGDKKVLAVVIKGDVQGSIEAIIGSLDKLRNDEVSIKVVHSAVGAVTESDITLANASNALVVAFNVRANVQAKEMSNRDKVEIRYYSIIYEVVDDAIAALSGLMSPIKREEFIGYAEIREVFNITKVGKIAGCYVTEGHVKRGAGVRLLRDNVVIHEGKLKTLKRFKDEVKDVQNGYECGMAFENYDDVKAGDVIECYEIVEEAAKLNIANSKNN